MSTMSGAAQQCVEAARDGEGVTQIVGLLGGQQAGQPADLIRIVDLVQIVRCPHPFGDGAIPDVPLVEGEADALVQPQVGQYEVDQGGVLPRQAFQQQGLRQRLRRVITAHVHMQGEVIDIGRRFREHRRIPLRTVFVAHGHELDTGVDEAHRFGRLARHQRVVVRGALSDLPAAIHLVAQAPQPDVIGPRVAVGGPLPGDCGGLRRVAIFQPIGLLLGRPRAQVDAQVRLTVELRAIREEFVRPELVALHRAPRQLASRGPARGRSRPIAPLVHLRNNSGR